ncbi:caspase recruitment domain-containing protein 19 isoform X3 [Cricetulus griseus]|uniref:Caspase recruitment domain-containing protein 19 isoform X3 n=1 Tax=Cricetulus griseus TaxID=10029 RepID=A0A9J7GW17_CRIGR|nr:caspase recruitment domain-containing protein 19 isoform X3 [Cricetulus griseus]XP_035298852.1 caspase recruitment domain-containing protein 19 isoform X3 [Cricetulus griseus]
MPSPCTATCPAATLSGSVCVPGASPSHIGSYSWFSVGGQAPCSTHQLLQASQTSFSPGPMSFLAGLGLAAGLALILYCCPPGLTSLNPLRPAACSKPRLLYFLCPVMPESVIRGGLGDRARYGLLRPYPLKAWGSPRQELMISGARTSSDLSSPKQGPCTPKCCLGPDASLPSHLSSSTGMLAATCWPSWQMTSEGSDGPRPWALPAT